MHWLLFWKETKDCPFCHRAMQRIPRCGSQRYIPRAMRMACDTCGQKFLKIGPLTLPSRCQSKG